MKLSPISQWKRRRIKRKALKFAQAHPAWTIAMLAKWDAELEALGCPRRPEETVSDALARLTGKDAATIDDALYAFAAGDSAPADRIRLGGD